MQRGGLLTFNKLGEGILSIDSDDLPVSLATLESQHIYTQGVLSTHIIESESA